VTACVTQCVTLCCCHLCTPLDCWCRSAKHPAIIENTCMCVLSVANGVCQLQSVSTAATNMTSLCTAVFVGSSSAAPAIACCCRPAEHPRAAGSWSYPCSREQQQQLTNCCCLQP
jgi:hypothetical protein